MSNSNRTKAVVAELVRTAALIEAMNLSSSETSAKLHQHLEEHLESLVMERVRAIEEMRIRGVFETIAASVDFHKGNYDSENSGSVVKTAWKFEAVPMSDINKGEVC